MKVLKKLDDTVIDGKIGVQAFVNVVEWSIRLVDLKYYNQAKVCIVVTAAYACSIDISFSANQFAEKSIVHIPIISILLWTFVIFSTFMRVRVAKNATDKGFRNPERDSGYDIFWRFAFFVLTVMQVIRLFLDSGNYLWLLPVYIGITLTQYVMACQEAPPKNELVFGSA